MGRGVLSGTTASRMYLRKTTNIDNYCFTGSHLALHAASAQWCMYWCKETYKAESCNSHAGVVLATAVAGQHWSAYVGACAGCCMHQAVPRADTSYTWIWGFPSGGMQLLGSDTLLLMMPLAAVACLQTFPGCCGLHPGWRAPLQSCCADCVHLCLSWKMYCPSFLLVAYLKAA